MEDNRILKVWFSEGKVFVSTLSGDVLSHPLDWFPRLLNANDKERATYEITPFGVHWTLIDEDLSLEGFYNFKPTTELNI